MQKNIWEKEYNNPKLVTGYDRPQSFFLKFLKYLKKEKKVNLDNLKVLDLGCGVGRNSNYLAQKGFDVVGMDISETAIKIAKERSEKIIKNPKYLNRNMGLKYPFSKNEFDLIVDITASNSLNEKERKVYLKEVSRVLKETGFFFVRALCKDGDKNAKKLLELNPGREKDTYIMPGTGLTERVFSEKDFKEMYSQYFKIIKMEKTESYSRIERKVFKRKFWLVVMKTK